MKKKGVFFKKNFFLILLLLATAWLFLPQLQVPWRLIDDGESLRVAQEIEKRVKTGDFSGFFWVEKESGRLRPFYWLYHFFTFKLFGFSAFFHHFSHLLVYLLTIFLIYKLLFVLSGQSLASFLGGVFFLLFPPAFENFYRLGTAEPTFTLYFLFLSYFLVKKNLILSIFFLSILYFTKETSIVFLPASIGFFVLSFLLNQTPQEKSSWQRFFLIFFLANLVLAFSQRLIMAKLGISGFYSDYYSFSLLPVLKRSLIYLKMIFVAYHLFLLVAGVSFLINLTLNLFLRPKIKPDLFWQINFLFLFFLFLAIQAPWPFVMGRYLPPALVGLMPFLAIENARIVKFLLSSKKVFAKGLLVFFVLVFTKFVFANTGKVVAMYQAVISGETTNKKAVEFLAKNTPSDGSIFYNFSDGAIEYLYEMPLHFQFFYQRDDITTDFLLLEAPYEFKKDNLLVSWKPVVERYPLEEVKNRLKNLEELKVIDNQWFIFRFREDENYYPSPSF